MSNFLIFKAAFNNSVTPAIGTYTAEGATASFTQNASLSPDYYLYNPNASITAVQWFVPTKETTDFEFVADILTDDQALGDRYFIIADSAGTTGMCMLSSSSITEWRFMNGDSTATSDPEYVGAIDPATSGGFGVFHQFRVRVRKLTASSSSVEVYVDGTLKLTATAGAALVTCAKIGFIGGVTGSPSTSAGIQNVYVYDLSGGDVVDRGVLSEAFNRFIDWNKGIFAAKEDYVPRSGGAVLTGALAKVNDTSALSILGAPTVNGGALINLYGKNEGTSLQGAYLLQAYNDIDGNYRYFIGYPNGSLTWHGQPIQYVSDQRLKQQIAEIDDKLLDAWEDVTLCQFKYNDAVKEKSDNARLHTGYVVQQIDKACKEHDVDVSQYGLYCHEEYPQETEEVEVEQADGTKVKEKKVIREASEHYSLRYTEVYAVECMYLRRCIKQLTARIEQLEKGKEQEASK